MVVMGSGTLLMCMTFILDLRSFIFNNETARYIILCDVYNNVYLFVIVHPLIKKFKKNPRIINVGIPFPR